MSYREQEVKAGVITYLVGIIAAPLANLGV